jgi:hypothetical protein
MCYAQKPRLRISSVWWINVLRAVLFNIEALAVLIFFVQVGDPRRGAGSVTHLDALFQIQRLAVFLSLMEIR